MILWLKDACQAGYHTLRKDEKEGKLSEKVCKGVHSGHLCVLASNEKFEEIKELTKTPEYICFNCGRVADCNDNLCNPMPLK